MYKYKTYKEFEWILSFNYPQDYRNQYRQKNQQAWNRYIRLIPWGTFKACFFDFRQKPVAH